MTKPHYLVAGFAGQNRKLNGAYFCACGHKTTGRDAFKKHRSDANLAEEIDLGLMNEAFDKAIDEEGFNDLYMEAIIKRRIEKGCTWMEAFNQIMEWHFAEQNEDMSFYEGTA